ncbi:hypothetical protein [Chitinophaga nivalis]|uniref:DUF3997 domain-containing protein n=1 Tax=Chitinophaga nivalis TaxID=2991709 RepID=A0ABT3IKK0_9BACT|nr:hypothetical protein [Chitinophaga nivalis]MCW3465827.1 hypothetical protein [Chitinophaga nivalis]MCW3484482.1 hypothetical protein [Chitinophaga nivalis]
MKKYLKVFIASFLFFVLFVVIVWWVYIPGEDTFIQYKTIEVATSNKEMTVFIRQKIWGINADHRLVYITNNKAEKIGARKNTDYIFNGFSPIFYKQSNDTIYIFCSVASITPPNWINSFNITQIELSNSEMMNLLDKNNYKKENLNLIN